MFWHASDSYLFNLSRHMLLTFILDVDIDTEFFWRQRDRFSVMSKTTLILLTLL